MDTDFHSELSVSLWYDILCVLCFLLCMFLLCVTVLQPVGVIKDDNGGRKRPMWYFSLGSVSRPRGQVVFFEGGAGQVSGHRLSDSSACASLHTQVRPRRRRWANRPGARKSMADSSVGEPGRACEALLSRRWVAPLNAHAVVYNARARSLYIKLVKARHQLGVRACVRARVDCFVRPACTHAQHFALALVVRCFG